MENKLESYFIINFDEKSKSYGVLHIDWDSLRMTYIIRSSDKNKFISKAWISETGELDYKINVYTSEDDEEFNDKLLELRSMPIYSDNKKGILSDLKNKGYFNRI